MTPHRPSTSADLRLEHACLRMNELLAACTLYLSSNPIRIEREFFDLGAKRCVRFKYRVHQPPR